MCSDKPEMMLYADSNRGQYIPQHFAESIKRDCVSGIRLELLDILATGPDSPDGPDYWEIWQDVCDNAVVTDHHGYKYRLWQDGDLWLVPEDMEWNCQTESFVWPED